MARLHEFSPNAGGDMVLPLLCRSVDVLDKKFLFKIHTEHTQFINFALGADPSQCEESVEESK